MLELIIPSHHKNYLAPARRNNSLILTQPTPLLRLTVHRSLLWYSYKPNQTKKKKICRADLSLSCSCRAARII